jgi:twinkle protein
MVSFSEYGIKIPSDASGEVRAICPECTPSRKHQHQNERDLAVNIDEGTWYCHHCGWSGGLKQKKEDLKPAYLKPSYNPLDLPPKLIQWFKDRGISKKTLDAANIGYQQPQGKRSGAITFPRYKGGECVAIKYRTHDKRMWQSKSPEPCFYNHDGALNHAHETLIISEGEIDALSFIEARLPCVASVPDGAPNPTAQNLSTKFKFLEDGLVDHFKSFVLAVDNDEPGKFLEKELADRLGRHNCLSITYPSGCKDANDVLKNFGPEALREAYTKAQHYPIDGLYTIEDARDDIFDLYESGLRPGLSTGWGSVDALYTVRTCEMTIVTGIPGSGKSTWLDALMVNLNRMHHWRIAYCSPENWPIQRHMANLAEKIAMKPFAACSMTAERMTREEMEDALQVLNKNFYFTQLQEDEMGIDAVLDVMQSAISRHGVKGIVLDPWNELEYHRPQNLTETEFVSRSLGKIRRFARLNDVHVWIVAHPTKLKRNEDGTYPVPRLYDISGSAHWYNKADNGIAIYRRTPTKPEVEVHVQKIRFREVGCIGSTQLKFVKDCGIYMELSANERVNTQSTNHEIDDVPF